MQTKALLHVAFSADLVGWMRMRGDDVASAVLAMSSVRAPQARIFLTR